MTAGDDTVDTGRHCRAVAVLGALPFLVGCLTAETAYLVGGVTASAHSGGESGLGWAAAVRSQHEFTDAIPCFGWELRFEQTDYDGESGKTSRIGAAFVADYSSWALCLGWAGHSEEHDAWGTGPRVALEKHVWLGYRIRCFARSTVYAWFGERAESFDTGVEGSISIGLAFIFRDPPPASGPFMTIPWR